MIYIYCSSTYPIFVGLKLISEEEPITFIYSRKNYKHLFELLKVDHYFVEALSFMDLLNMRKTNITLKKLNKKVEISDVYFTHLQFSTILFIFLYNRKKDVNNYFYPFEPITQNKYNVFDIIKNIRSFLKAFVGKYFSLLFYKSNLKISFYMQTFFLSLDKNDFMKINVQTINTNYTYEELQRDVSKNIQFNYRQISNLYIGQNEKSLAGKAYSESSVNNIFSFIIENKIAVKPHPSGYDYPKVDEIIDPNIPSEFLFSKIKGSIISINSTTLISASHYYGINSKTKIICLMHIIKYNDKDSQQEMVERIKERALNNILYPNSLEELRELIK